jgi:hypothetical protein
MIIGISGKARSGKDTFAEMLATELNKGAYPPYVMMAFANELKLKCQEAFDLTWEQLWGNDKEVPDERYRKYYQTAALTGTGELPSGYWTAREIMQDFGAFYRSIDSEFWIKNLFKAAAEKDYTNVIVTDVRYINEADYIINNGGYVIRVERENKDTVHNEQHPSEVELDDYKRFDFTVVNNWTLDHLKFGAGEVASFLRDSENDLRKLKEIKIDG